MGRQHRLRRGSGAGGTVLAGHPSVLADAAGRRADAQLFGNSAEDRAARGGGTGFPDPGATRSWHRRADQFVRNRIARADIVAGDRGVCRRTGRGVSVVGPRQTSRIPREVSRIAAVRDIGSSTETWHRAALRADPLADDDAVFAEPVEKPASAGFRSRYASTARSR